MKEEDCMIISTDAEKKFDKIQHRFITKTLLNRKKRELTQLKGSYKKGPTVCAALKVKAQRFPENKVSTSALTTFI